MLKLFLQFTEAMKKKEWSEQTEAIKVTQVWKFQVFLNPHTQLNQFIVDNKFTKCEETRKEIISYLTFVFQSILL